MWQSLRKIQISKSRTKCSQKWNYKRYTQTKDKIVHKTTSQYIRVNAKLIYNIHIKHVYRTHARQQIQNLTCQSLRKTHTKEYRTKYSYKFNYERHTQTNYKTFHQNTSQHTRANTNLIYNIHINHKYRTHARDTNVTQTNVYQTQHATTQTPT